MPFHLSAVALSLAFTRIRKRWAMKRFNKEIEIRIPPGKKKQQKMGKCEMRRTASHLMLS